MANSTDDNKHRIHIYLDPYVKEQVRQAAGRYDISMAAYIRRAVTMQMHRDGLELDEQKDQTGEEAPAWLRRPS